MPLVRISLRRGKSAEYRKALADGVHAAMRESFNVPEEDRFIIVHEHDETDFFFSSSYMDIGRDDDLVIIQITANNTRTVDQKKAFIKSVSDHLSASPGVKMANIFVNIVEVAKENWSFGNGIAQYA